jgi:hypothetical protein
MSTSKSSENEGMNEKNKRRGVTVVEKEKIR